MAVDDVVEVAKILSHQTRVDLLDALFDGRAYTVTELSRHVGIAPSTASEHLAKMLDADLVSIEPQGRHRYYRLRDASVAHMLETLYTFSPRAPVRRSSRVPPAMVYARSCYDHLAGTVAVALADHLSAAGFVAGDGDAVHMTDAGVDGFASLGLVAPVASARPAIRTCLDWSERRHHHAGAMPANLLTLMLDRGWLQRQASSRALVLTAQGRSGLHQALGFEAPSIGDPGRDSASLTVDR